jgi:hypothetical protein
MDHAIGVNVIYHWEIHQRSTGLRMLHRDFNLCRSAYVAANADLVGYAKILWHGSASVEWDLAVFRMNDPVAVKIGAPFQICTDDHTHSARTPEPV